MSVAQCVCGMFAVGTCQICGKPLCGDHGERRDGIFVCPSHRAEAVAEEIALAERAAGETIQAARQKRLRKQELKEAAAPGFPQGEATPAAVSAALARLVPDHVRRYVQGRKSLGRTVSVRGWGFPMLSGVSESFVGTPTHQAKGLVVTEDGRAFTVWRPSRGPVSTLDPADFRSNNWVWESTRKLSADDVTLMFAEVLEWTGRLEEFKRSMADAGLVLEAW